MRKGYSFAMLLSLLITSSVTSFAQYINATFDFDSTLDFGWNIFILSDSNFLVSGAAFNVHTNKEEVMWMSIKKDGSLILSKHIIKADSASFYDGNIGTMKKLPDDGYIIPMDKHFSLDSPAKNSAGLVRLNAMLDTVFVRTYTDTAINYDIINNCVRLNDGSYFIGGDRSKISNYNIDSALLMHVDSVGNLLWEKTYKNAYPGIYYQLVSLQILPGERVLAGVMIKNIKTETIGLQSQTYYVNSPWFMILDTAGNILKDTLYNAHYSSQNWGDGGTESIHLDARGGYFIWGYLDSFITNNPSNVQNLPDYVAHLDDSFRMTWVTNFADLNAYYDIDEIIQLRDSNYLLIGEDNGYWGWAAKVNSMNGAIIWEHTYIPNYNDGWAYLVDGFEKSNGNIVMTGSADDSAYPNWCRQNVWLLEVDSNGCEVPGCLPTAVNSEQVTVNNFKVWPNPTTGAINVRSAEAGELMLFDMVGKVVAEYKIESGETNLQLPYKLASGLYVGKFVGSDGDMQAVRIVKQ